MVSRIKSKTMTSKTAAGDGDIVLYLIQQWSVSWCSSAVLVVIMKVAEMHGVVDVAIDVDVAVAYSRDMSGKDSM